MERIFEKITFVAAIAFVMRFWPSDRWYALALISYVPAVLYLLFSIVALVIIRKKEQRKLVAFSIPVLLAIGSVATIVYDNRRAMAKTATTQAPAQQIKILHWNVWASRRGVADIASVIAEQNPDVICLNEPKLSRKSRTYPPYDAYLPEYRHVWAENNMMILSRIPLEKMKPFKGPEVWGLMARFATNRFVKLLFLDVGADFSFSRKGSFEWLQTQLAMERPLPDVIVGDFNTTSGSYSLETTLLRDYNDAYLLGRGGPGYTWPVWLPMIRIDFILSRKGVAVKAHKVGYSALSDHAWQWVELSN